MWNELYESLELQIIIECFYGPFRSVLPLRLCYLPMISDYQSERIDPKNATDDSATEDQ